VGDTRLEVTTVDGMQLCWVPEGPFLMGSEDRGEDAKPQHECALPYGFWMARYPVTTAQFREFREHRYGRTNEPVMEVSWYDAAAFCEWLTERWRKVGRLPKGWEVQLPSEAEWEKAARGGLVVPTQPAVAIFGESPGSIELKDNGAPGRRYPWGEEADPNRANYRDTGVGDPSAVGCFPASASAYGCEELSGNVWELTRSFANDGREDSQASSQVLCVLRGGSFFDDSSGVRCAARGRSDPHHRLYNLGFRVVQCPFPL
jgi:iron(II)-dependent oxidoreductase